MTIHWLAAGITLLIFIVVGMVWLIASLIQWWCWNRKRREMRVLQVQQDKLRLGIYTLIATGQVRNLSRLFVDFRVSTKQATEQLNKAHRSMARLAEKTSD